MSILYADDLVLVGVTEEELRRKVEILKEKLEIKGSRVNVLETKVMVSRKHMGSLIGYTKSVARYLVPLSLIQHFIVTDAKGG